MEKEIIYNFYINMQAPYKEQFKTLFNMWCLTIFNKTFELTEDNVYTFLCDYFKFEFITSGGQKNLWVNNKLGFYITSINYTYINRDAERNIVKHIRENI